MKDALDDFLNKPYPVVEERCLPYNAPELVRDDDFCGFK